MWHEITTDQELSDFVETMYNFHDSCIKEISYISGAYVNDNLSMYPVNDCRVLKILIQRQFEPMSMIEMEFAGLKYLKLFPVDNNYTCEIHGAYMVFRDNLIYWCDQEEPTEIGLDNNAGVVLCATKFRWRSIDNCMGKGIFYQPVVQ